MGEKGVIRGVISVLLSVSLLYLGFSFNHTSAYATSIFINFDPPAFSSGQVLQNVDGITFLDHPIVFSPSGGTSSQPNALENAQQCNNSDCTNNANELRMTFPQVASSVSLMAGTEGTAFCIPEGGGGMFYLCTSCRL